MDRAFLEELVLSHASVVEQELAKFHVGKLDREDLRQAGLLGLLVAATRFDPSKGPFSPYARQWARKEMQRAVAGTEFAAVVPTDYIGRVVALRGLASEVATTKDLASRVRLSEATTASLLRVLEVDMPPGEVFLPAPHATEDEAIARAISAAVAEAVDGLPEDDQAVLAETYREGAGSVSSIRAVSRRLGISPSTARIRLDRALGRLRRAIGHDSYERERLMSASTRTLDWTNLGFSISAPRSWEVFPGEPGPTQEIARIKREPVEFSLTLILWKVPGMAGTLDAFASDVQESLEAGGYADFAIGTTDIVAGLHGMRLTARKKNGWTTSQYYFARDAAIYVLGWGTRQLGDDQGDIDAVTSSLRLA